MSRQSDRRDLEPTVRIRMAEDDLDRVDQRFEETVGKIEHKATNLDVAIKGLGSQVQQVVADHKAELAQIRSDHKAEMKRLEETTGQEVGNTRKLLTGLLVSMVLASVSFVSVIITMRTGG